MIWKKITIDTKTEAADIVASVLFDNGIIGAEIEDNQSLSDEDLKKMYVDIPLDKIDDGNAKVSFYISIKEDGDEKTSTKDVDNNLVDNSYIMSTDNIFSRSDYDNIFGNIKNELKSYRDFVDMGSLNISETELDDKVFLNKWKENFKGVKIDDIEILPNWEKNSDKSCSNNELSIYIEPGSAFGTGKHPTTSLCVKATSEIMKESRGDFKVLDVGAGSGILSIIAMKLGVEKVVAVDIDKSVENNLLENLELNDINSFKKFDENKINFLLYKDVSYIYGFGNILTDKWVADFVKNISYDIVVANILAPVIISLLGMGKITSYLKSGGYLILSGIIKEKEEELIAAIKNDKTIKDYKIYREDEWLMFKCIKG